MTYYELLENYLYEKATSEFYDESQLDTLVDEGFVISHEPDTYDYTLIKSLSESKIVVKYEGEYSSPEFMILNGSRDVTHEEVGSIADIDEFLAKDYLAELAAEKARTSKLITVGSLEKILDKYDSEKGISTKNGTVTINGRQIAFYSDVSSVGNSLNSLQSSVNTTLNKKAEKTHTHKAADITDMPNFVKTVNGENPDTDGNINIDADSVVEVTELPAEAEKKVYLKPEKNEVSVNVDCTSIGAMLSDVATWLTGTTQNIQTGQDFFNACKKTLSDKGNYSGIKSQTENSTGLKIKSYNVTLAKPISINGAPVDEISLLDEDYGARKDWKESNYIYDNSNTVLYSNKYHRFVIDFYSKTYCVFSFSDFVGIDDSFSSGFVKSIWDKITLSDGTTKNVLKIEETKSPPSSMVLGEDASYPAEVFAKNVQLATQESISDLQAKIDAINAILTKNNLS